VIEQSPAVRALGAELGQAIRLDRARRVRRHRMLTVVAVLVLLAGGALRLAPGLAERTETAVVRLPSSEAGDSADAAGGPALIGCISPERAGSAGPTLFLWHPFASGGCQGPSTSVGGIEGTAAPGFRKRLTFPPGASSPSLRDAPWLHRFAVFVN